MDNAATTFEAGGMVMPTLQSLIDDIHRVANDPTAPVYIGIYRCGGRVAVPQNRSVIYGLIGEFGRVYVIAESPFVTALDGRQAPLHLRYMSISTASNVEQAARYLYTVTARVNTMFQVSANAPTDIIHETLLLESKGDIEGDLCRETPFYGAAPYPQNTRVVDKNATAMLINALWGHVEQQRLTRACVQYEMALSHWREGSRPLSLMHLYMGIEALTEAVLREEIRTRQVSEAELMRELGVEPNLQTSGSLLRARVRQRRIFQDEATYRRARAFSDSLEHGFGNEADLWNVPGEVHVNTARYLRTAIIRLLEPKPDAYSLLLSPPYDSIVSPIEPPHYLTRVSSDQIRWRETEFTVMGLVPTLVTVQFDEGKREYQPTLAFIRPAHS